MNLKICFIFATVIVTKINALEPILILKEGNFVNSYYDISEVAKFAVENGKSSKIDDQNAIILLAQNLFSNGLTDEIAKSGILSALIEYMDSSNPDVKHGATILLAHIAYNSTKMVQLIVEEGAIPRFFKSLDSSNENVVVHSLIFFNTLVLSHPNLRNNYSELELVQNIHTLVDSKPSTLVLQYSTTLFYGLSRNKNPSISHEAIKAMLPVFSKFLQHPHYQIAGNSALTLAILTSNKENGYMIMFEEEDIQNLIELLNRQNEHVQTSTLQLISKIIDNSEHETQLFLDKGILQLLTNFLKNSDDDDIVFWALQIIQKIIPSSNAHIATMFNLDIIPLIAKKFISDSRVEIQQIATIIILNIAIRGNESQVSLIIDMNIIPTFCDLLKQREYEILIEYSLIAILKSLQKAKNQNCFIFSQLIKCGGFVELEKLENYGKINIENSVKGILTIYEQQSVYGTCQKELLM